MARSCGRQRRRSQQRRRLGSGARRRASGHRARRRMGRWRGWERGGNGDGREGRRARRWPWRRGGSVSEPGVAKRRRQRPLRCPRTTRCSTAVAAHRCGWCTSYAAAAQAMSCKSTRHAPAWRSSFRAIELHGLPELRHFTCLGNDHALVVELGFGTIPGDAPPRPRLPRRRRTGVDEVGRPLHRTEEVNPLAPRYSA